MARLPELKQFGLTHGIRIVAVADMIRWRLTHERLVKCEIDTVMATPDHGEFQARVYRATGGGLHLALIRGDLSGPAPVLTRVQTAAGPADVFKALTSDSAAQIDAALAAISPPSWPPPARRMRCVSSAPAHRCSSTSACGASGS
jgi:3,4-dihydroxy 2-butanone 4-phosphate synthase/GTP cyclohydrolase II